MKRQGQMESISRPQQQVKDHEITLPAPNQMTQRKHGNHDDGIKREEIGSQSNDKIGFGDDHMPPRGSDFHFFDLPAKKPGPQGVGELMTEDV